jgi:hypothetical protein
LQAGALLEMSPVSVTLGPETDQTPVTSVTPLVCFVSPRASATIICAYQQFHQLHGSNIWIEKDAAAKDSLRPPPRSHPCHG